MFTHAGLVMNVPYFFRAFTGECDQPGGLVARRAFPADNPPDLTRPELLVNFRNHSILNNREPTALVSTSSRIIDTIARAFRIIWENKRLGPDDVSIAIIESPEHAGGQPPRTQHTPPVVHHAQALAEECGHESANLFKYEWIFEWQIPIQHVRVVSLGDLMRDSVWNDSIGQLCKTSIDEGHRPSSKDLHRILSTVIFSNHKDMSGWLVSNIAKSLVDFAWPFGATVAGVVARQLEIDCLKDVTPRDIFENQWVVVSCGGKKESWAFEELRDLEDEMDASLERKLEMHGYM